MVSIINKIRTFISRFKDKNFRKGVSTFIGSCIINFFAGTIYSLCTLSIYEISYVKENHGTIDIHHSEFYYPIEILFQCFSSILSGILYKELGLHITNLIGINILCVGYLMMYISKSLALDMLCMILGGIGTGIILYPSTTNAYRWFPEHNGIIVGVMETMISFGSFSFSFIGELMINKEKVPSDKETNLYNLEVAKRVKTYLLMQILTLIIAFILSFLLMFIKAEDNEKKMMSDVDQLGDSLENEDNKETQETTNSTKESTSNDEKIDEKNKNDKSINQEDNNDTLKINEEKKKKEKKTKNKKIKDDKDFYDEGDKEEDDDEEEKKKRPLLGKKDGDDNDNDGEEIGLLTLLKYTFKSKRLVLFSVIMILQSPVSNMAFTLYREIGEYKKIDLKYLQLVGSLYFIFECLSSFVFGVLCDYIQLKYLLFFINAVGTLVGFIYCLTFNNGLIFFLVQNFLSFSAGGYYPVKDCYIMKVFGNELYIELNGLVSFLVALTVNLLTPITYVVDSNISNKEIGYWILFVSFGTLNLIGLILNIFLKETPVDLKAEYLGDKVGRLNVSLRYFRNSFKHSFHTSFHMV